MSDTPPKAKPGKGGGQPADPPEPKIPKGDRPKDDRPRAKITSDERKPELTHALASLGRMLSAVLKDGAGYVLVVFDEDAPSAVQTTGKGSQAAQTEAIHAVLGQWEADVLKDPTRPRPRPGKPQPA